MAGLSSTVPRPFSSFIGRAEELQTVQTLLGTHRLVTLTGAAGIGKTRVAQERSRFVGELPGARVLCGRCAPYGEGRDLAAIAELVRTACGIGDGDDAATARERVTRTVARLEHPAYAGPVPRAMGERLRVLLGL